MKVALISPLIKTTPNLGKWKENAEMGAIEITEGSGWETEWKGRRLT